MGEEVTEGETLQFRIQAVVVLKGQFTKKIYIFKLILLTTSWIETLVTFSDASSCWRFTELVNMVAMYPNV